jgi:hypothetical protein
MTNDLSIPLFHRDKYTGFVMNIDLAVPGKGLVTAFPCTDSLWVQELYKRITDRFFDILPKSAVIFAVKSDVFQLWRKARTM